MSKDVLQEFVVNLRRSKGGRPVQFQGLNEAFTKIGEAFTRTNDTMEKTQAAFEETNETLGKTSQAFDKTNDALAKTNESLSGTDKTIFNTNTAISQTNVVLAEAQRAFSETEESTTGANKAFKQTNKSLGQTGKQANKGNLSLQKIEKRLFELAKKIIKFKELWNNLLDYTSQGEQLGFLAQSTNASVGFLEAFGRAMREFGGDEKIAAEALKNFNKHLLEFQHTGGGVFGKAKTEFGLDLTGVENIEEAVFRIADCVSKLNAHEKIEFKNLMGMDDAALSMLQIGIEALNAEMDRAQAFNIYSEKDVKNAHELQRALRGVKDGILGIKGVISKHLAPIIIPILQQVEKFFAFLLKHEGFIIGFLGAISIILGIIAIKMGIISLLALPITWSFYAVLAVILLIAAAIGIIIDDIYTFLQGGDSLIGRFIKFFKDLSTNIKGLRQDFKAWLCDIVPGAKTFLEILELILEVIKDIICLIPGVGPLVRTFIDFFTSDDDGQSKNKRMFSPGSIVGGRLAEKLLMWFSGDVKNSELRNPNLNVFPTPWGLTGGVMPLISGAYTGDSSKVSNKNIVVNNSMNFPNAKDQAGVQGVIENLNWKKVMDGSSEG